MPYGLMPRNAMWAMTILHGLRLRGAEVEYVMCDGLFSECDMYRVAHAPRPANACTFCQAQTAKLAHGMNTDFRWLGRYLMPDEGRKAERWTRSLAVDELLSATYGDWKVGEWVASSVHTHFRANELNLADEAIERGTRRYVRSGLIACFALDRLLTENAPDVMLQFNGRGSSTRVALELARARGIRVVGYEEGLRAGSLAMFENVDCLSLAPLREYWHQWADVPLSSDELEDVTRYMSDREHGRNLVGLVYASAPQPLDDVRAQLGLQADRPVWVLFTSSDDEVVGHDDYLSAFASQLEWIERTVEHARRNPQIDLVIRAHPNTGGRRSVGFNRIQLEQLRRLRQNLPPNARMVDPDDDVSSYSLMDISTVALVWVSTVGIELACKGKHVVVAAGSSISGMPFAHTVESAAGYDEMLESMHALPPGAACAEIRRLALRFAYGSFFRLRIPFPLVSCPDNRDWKLACDSLEALLPGRDAGLDRCARILLDREPVCPPPTAAQRARSAAAEDASLAQFDRRRIMVLAFAGELIADKALLHTWAQVFSDRRDVTLLIQTSQGEIPHLVEAVTGAGLDGDDGPELVAGEFEPDATAAVDAVFSRITRGDVPGVIPRYDTVSLRQFAESV